MLKGGHSTWWDRILRAYPYEVRSSQVNKTGFQGIGKGRWRNGRVTLADKTQAEVIISWICVINYRKLCAVRGSYLAGWSRWSTKSAQYLSLKERFHRIHHVSILTFLWFVCSQEPLPIPPLVVRTAFSSWLYLALAVCLPQCTTISSAAVYFVGQLLRGSMFVFLEIILFEGWEQYWPTQSLIWLHSRWFSLVPKLSFSYRQFVLGCWYLAQRSLRTMIRSF